MERCAPGHHGKLAILLADRPRLGHSGHQCSHAPGRPNLHLISSVQSSIPAPVAGRFNTPFSSGSVTTDWLVTIRPRVGWAFDRFLVYGTGGLAVTHQHNSLTDIDSTTVGGVIGTFNATSSQTVGWTAGGGIEYAIANNWSVKAEYLYLDFGDVTGSAGGGVSGLGLDSASVSVTSHLTANIVRAGLNYQFH